MDKGLREEVFRLHAEVCGGLADPIRILILYTLADSPYSVTDLVRVLEVPQPTVSRHLRTLRERGMVNTQRSGQSIYYELTDERIIQALDLLRAVLRDHLSNRAELVDQLD